jgi:hypothetical protein
VSAGGTATYHLTISPSAGSTFPAAVTFSANGAPTGSTVTITPQTIAAGAGATNVTVAVQVPTTAAAVRRSNTLAFGLALPLIGMLVPFAMERKRHSMKRLFFAVVLFTVLVSTGTFLGCGGSAASGSPAHQSTNYTITVTATSGSVSHSTNLTLTVQ